MIPRFLSLSLPRVLIISPSSAHRSVTEMITRNIDQVAAPSKNAVAAKIAAVAAAAVLVSAAPVFAADDAVKNAVCARTPTAKLCLRDSAKQ